jgi:hypothetical protein
MTTSIKLRSRVAVRLVYKDYIGKYSFEKIVAVSDFKDWSISVNPR